MIEGGVEVNGVRISRPVDLDAIKRVSTSIVEWNATWPTGANVSVEVAITDNPEHPPTERHEWLEAVNGEPVPDLNWGDDLSGKYLWVRQTLTSSSEELPKLHEIDVEIEGQRGSAGYLLSKPQSMLNSKPHLRELSYDLNDGEITVDVIGSPGTENEEIIEAIELTGQTAIDLDWESEHTIFQTRVHMERSSWGRGPEFDSLTLESTMEYELKIEVEGAGNVGVNGPRYFDGDTLLLDAGTRIDITTHSGLGWSFDRWELDLSGDTPQLTEWMMEDKVLRAVFKRDTFVLTVDIEGWGYVEVDGEKYWNNDAPVDIEVYVGDTVGLEAQPDDGWHFRLWTGDLSGGNPTEELLIDGNKSVTAVFTDVYVLHLDIWGEGSVVVEGEEYTHRDVPAWVTVSAGGMLELEAIAAGGWKFERWEGDLSGDSPVGEIFMDGNKQVTALFDEEIIPTYDLELDIEGAGSILVNGVEYSNPDVPARRRFQLGQEIELVAQPANKWEFVGWSGDLTTDQLIERIVMEEGGKSVTAAFDRERHDLLLEIEGEGAVYVDGQEYTAADVPVNLRIDTGTVVELEAAADHNWKFSRWEGDISGGDTETQLAMLGPRTLRAVFEDDRLERFTLALDIVGEGSVIINGTEYTAFHAPVEVNFTTGTQVELEAEPLVRWDLLGWSGDLDGDSRVQTLLLDADKQVVANFERVGYRLLLEGEGEGSIAVGGETYGVEDMPTGVTVRTGETATLEAVAAPGWRLAHWEEDLGGDSNPQSLLLDADKQVRAVFERATYELTFDIEGEGYGYIEGDTYTGPVDILGGETLSLEAVGLWEFGEQYWEFVGWSGDFSGTAAAQSLFLDGNKEITLSFERRETYRLTVDIEGPGGVYIYEHRYTEPLQLPAGESIPVEAKPDDLCYAFRQWGGDLSGDKSRQYLNRTDDSYLTALFAMGLESGSGTADAPYEITDWYDLNSIRCLPESYYRLVNDLDQTVAGYSELAGEAADEGAGWLPVGDLSEHFTGEIDGQGNRISDLYINRQGTAYVGVFGYMSGGATLEDLELYGLEIIGDTYAGGLVGYFDPDSGKLTDVHISGKISGSSRVGGLVGVNYGEITGASVDMQVAAEFPTFVARRWAGGLVGRNMGRGQINRSAARGSVFGAGNRVGGLAGDNYGDIHNSYSEAEVLGGERVGGLLGYNQGLVENTYARGPVEGGSRNVGGLVGDNVWHVRGSFWDYQQSGQSVSDGGSGKSTSEMTSYVLYDEAGWEIARSQSPGNQGYPYFGGDTQIWLIEATEVEIVVEIDGVGDVLVNGETYVEPVLVEAGDAVSFEAVETVGWDFTGWSGDLSGEQPERQIVVERDMTVGAAFGETFVLTVEIRGSGEVLVDGELYEEPVAVRGAQQLELEATAAAPWELYRWASGLSGSSPEQQLLLDADRTVEAQFWPGGGTAEEPFEITDWYELDMLRQFGEIDYIQMHYQLQADLDASSAGYGELAGPAARDGSGWLPLGDGEAPFEGLFRGEGRRISGLYIERPELDYVGLFGALDGEVRNLELKGFEITGRDYSGGLAGWSGEGSELFDLRIAGQLSGRDDVGAVAGVNAGRVEQAGGDVELTGSGRRIGGLVGQNLGVVENSYLRGKLSGGELVGGAVGENRGTLRSSYAAALVEGTESVGGLVGARVEGSTPGSFWDVEVAGTDVSAGGSGRSTQQLKEIGTFLQFGWDIGGSAEDENDGYPFFSGGAQIWAIPQSELTLTLEIVGEGRVYVDGELYTEPLEVEAGQTVQLAAESEGYWWFAGYSGDLEEESATSALLVDFDKQITASFKDSYELQVDLVGAGELLVDGETYSEPLEVNGGETLQLEAVAAQYWKFAGYSGDLLSSERIEQLYIGGDRQLTVSFERDTELLTVEVVGAGVVKVDGAEYQEPLEYYTGETAVLAVESAALWYFAGWSGDLEGESAPEQLLLDADKTVEAEFSKHDTAQLTVEVEGAGQVLVEGEEYQQPRVVVAGERLTLEAIAQRIAGAEGYWKFAGWSGDYQGDTQWLEVELGEDKTVVAEFEPDTVQIDIQIEGSGELWIADESYTEQLQLRAGREYQLEASAAPGWKFEGWGGELSGTDTQPLLTVEEPGELSAWFTRKEFAGGDGTANNPYQIANWYQLDAVRDSADSNFLLIGQLDGGSYGYADMVERAGGWQPLGNFWDSQFSGRFNGQGYAIKDLQVERGQESYVGLFGYIAESGRVENLRIEQLQISGGNYTGAVAGRNDGLIEKVGVQGEITGDAQVGGVVGQNQGEGLVSNSYGRGQVSGSSRVGGLVGYNFGGRVESSFAAAIITGEQEIGGLVGSQWSALVEESFWDVEISGVAESAGGEGRTTEELNQIETFEVAGWSIEGVGPDENDGYPYLSGEQPVWRIALDMLELKIVVIEGVGEVLVNGDTYSEPVQIESGSTVELVAVAGENHHFVEWGGQLSGSESQQQFRLGDHSQLTVRFRHDTQLISVELEGAGQVHLNGEPYVEPLVVLTGETVLFEAAAAEYYHFTGWSGQFSEASSVVVRQVEEDKHLVANFRRDTYTLTVEVEGVGAVQVAGESYVESLVLPAGEAVELVAIDSRVSAVEYWVFTGWEEDLSGDQPQQQLFIDGDRQVRALFNKHDTSSLRVEVQGPGEVLVEGETYLEPVVALTGEQLQLEGRGLDSCYRLSEWDKALTGEEPVQQLTLAEDLTVKASFGPNFAGGTGSAEQPHEIADWYQLDSVRCFPEGHYRLIEELTAQTAGYAEVAGPEANGGSGWSPVGDEQAPFEGSFDGGHRRLQGLVIERPGADYVGLFGHLARGSRVERLGVVDISVVGRVYVGGIAGYNRGQIEQSYLSGEVTGQQRVGGLAGRNDIGASFSNSYSLAAVSGASRVGGLVGMNYGATLSYSYAAGPVSGDHQTGGLIGSNSFGTVVGSFWDKQVSGQQSSDGGGVGKSSEQMRQVETYEEAGWEIEAVLADENSGYPYFSAAGTTWSIAAQQLQLTVEIVGGSGEVRVDGAKYLGPVEVDAGEQVQLEAIAAAGWEFGGYSADLESDQPVEQLLMDADKRVEVEFVRGSYELRIDIEGEGQVLVDGESYSAPLTVTGGQSRQLEAVAASPCYRFGGWGGDITGMAVSREVEVLEDLQITGNFVADFAGGAGTQNSPYEIASWQQLANISCFVEADYRLVAELDRNSDGYAELAGGAANAGAGWKPLGEVGEPFSGRFDGAGRTVADLRIERPAAENVGLFGVVSGQITELNLAALEVVGELRVGGLAGRANNSAELAGIRVDGAVSGGEQVGGVVGLNRGDLWSAAVGAEITGERAVGGAAGINAGEIAYSKSHGAVAGELRAGGLVGVNRGQVGYSYSTAQLSGQNEVGGLIGRSEAEAGAEASFWDEQLSGRSVSAGGTGKSSRQLRHMDTYRAAGWSITPVVGDRRAGYPFLAGGTDRAWEKTIRLELSVVNSDGGVVLVDGETYLEPLPYSGDDQLQLEAKLLNDFWMFTGWSGDLSGSQMQREVIFESDIVATATFKLDLEGSGTEEDPYVVNTWDELDYVRQQKDAHFVMGGNLFSFSAGGGLATQASRSGSFEPLSSAAEPFTGSFDGGGNILAGLTIETEQGAAALFPYVDGGVVKNLGLIDLKVVGPADAGGLVGQLTAGRLENSFVRGEISGGGAVGGLVGRMSGGELINSYAAAAVSGGESRGGLIGARSGGAVRGALWAVDAAGLASSAGGVGVSSEALKSVEVLAEQGWQVRLTDSVENDGYPYLAVADSGWLLSDSQQPEPGAGLERLLVGPNPFRPSDGDPATGQDRLYFQFNSSGGPFKLSIYTLGGRLVYSTQTPEDPYPWEVRNRRGQAVSSGYYLYRVEDLDSGDLKTGKLAIVR